MSRKACMELPETCEEPPIRTGSDPGQRCGVAQDGPGQKGKVIAIGLMRWPVIIPDVKSSP